VIYVRYEGLNPIRQGFNFYAPNDGGSIGCQMLFWKLRIEVRYSKRTKKLRLGWWLKQDVEPTKEQFVYIPGYTEDLKKRYEDQNSYWGKKYEDWSFDD